MSDLSTRVEALIQELHEQVDGDQVVVSKEGVDQLETTFKQLQRHHITNVCQQCEHMDEDLQIFPWTKERLCQTCEQQRLAEMSPFE